VTVTDLPDFPDDPLAIAHFPRGLLSDQVQPVALQDGDYVLMDRTRRCQCGGHDDSCERECLWGYEVVGLLTLSDTMAESEENR
jgi:hypothetical protein